MADDSSNLFTQFTRDFGFYSIAGILPSFMGIAALIIFTHIFDAASYGRYALAMVFVSIVSTGLFDWLRQAILRYDSGEDDIEPTIMSLLLLLSIGVIAVGVVGYIFLRDTLEQFSAYYLAALGAIVGIGAFKVCSALFQARIQPRAVMKYKIIRGVLTHSLGFLVSIYLLRNIVGWVWGALLGSAAVVIMMLVQLDVRRLRWERDIVDKLAGYGLPMIGWLFGFTLLTFIDRLLIEFLKNTEAVGIYTANYTLVQTGLPLVLVPIIEAAHPVIMNAWDGENNTEISRMVAKYSRYFLLLGVPATVFAAIISQPLSLLALGNEYHPGYLIIPVIAVALFLWNFAMIGHKGLEVEDATGLMTIGVSIAVAANLGLNYLLIPMFGYIGASVATLASSGLYAVFAYLMSFRSVRWTIPKGTVIRVTISGASMIGVGTVGYIIPSAPVSGPIAGGIIGGLGYLFLLFVTGEFTDEEIAQAKSTINDIPSMM